jgi:flagellar biogenesis protein FliO
MDSMFSFDLINAGFKTMAMLFVVLGLLVLVLYGVKRLSIFNRGAKGTVPIHVLSSMYLSPKERIEVLEISGEKIVLGISQGHISFLTKLQDTEKSDGSS